MDGLPSFSELLTAAPVATLTVLILYVGWFLRGKASKDHIADLKQFIDFLKSRGHRKDD